MPIIQKDLTTGIGKIEFELEADEYIAIGRVMTQWAYLEHGIFAISVELSNAAKISIPEDANSTSFRRRLNTLRSLVAEYGTEDEKNRFHKLIGKITNAEQDRHKIAHAMWDWNPANPDKINASSFRPKYEFEKAYNAEKMNSLADRIGEISFALEYPEGWNEAFAQLLSEHTDEDGKVAFASISRRHHRNLDSQKALDHRENDPAKPTPRSPSNRT